MSLRNLFTYFAFGAFIFAASCINEAVEPDVYDWTDGNIYFKTSFVDEGISRAQDMTLENLESFQVTCFNTGDYTKDATGTILPYFEEATFIRQITPVGPVYVSSPYEDQRYWPATTGSIKFIAFAPSRAVMAADNPAITDVDRSLYFNLINTSHEINSTAAVGYRLGKIRVNPNIDRQIDFVTAEISGVRWKDFNNVVDLPFRHQMSQVDLKAWGASPCYDFEIAGVCLGNPVVEGTYIFSYTAFMALSGGWAELDATPVKDKVEYLYRGPEATPGGEIEIPGAGDRIFRINRSEHNTLESAQSIMGRGGCAMVIPTVNPRWEGLADPNIGTRPYSTDKMYFSILLRVTDFASGKQLYPYPDSTYEMAVVYYAVDNSGEIVTRLYPGQTKGTFFTDTSLQNQYVKVEGEEVKDFCWAAVPVDADWSAGKRYVYTLDYSDGIGVHDPCDPEPGKPIVVQSPVSWGVSLGSWQDAEKNDDYDPDVNVP